MQVRTLGTSGDTSLSTDIEFGKFDVFHIGNYHVIGEGIGPFIVTNIVGLTGTTYSWSSAYGDMEPTTGIESWLTLRRFPSRPNEKVTVVTTAALDASTHIEVTTPVDPCPENAFAVNFSTRNFSPHLAETCLISVTLPGCSCQNDPGWLEIEVLRETTGGFQHVAYVDMDTSTSTVDRYGDTMKLPSQSGFIWDGIAQAGLPLADHPDVFEGPKGSFNRAMPAIVAGDPVPPPFYTLVVRLWDEEKNSILNQAEMRVYIPQVVNLFPFGGESVFREPIYVLGTNGTEQIELYPGCTENKANEALALLPGMTRAFYPSDANLRIVMTEHVMGRHMSLLIVGASTRDARLGDASAFSPRNERPYGEMAVYIGGFSKSLQKNYDGMLAGNKDSIPDQMTPAQFAQYIAATVAHEIGHGVGLVDPSWLEAIESGQQKYHNLTRCRTKLMDAGGLKFVGHRLQPHPTGYWLPDNLRYLRFVLPKGE